jgi:hypothetical protein
MTYDPRKAQILQQLLNQGLSEEAALRQAGISNSDVYYYTVNDVSGDPNRGRVEPTVLGPPRSGRDGGDSGLFPWQQPGVDPQTGLAPDTRPSPLLTQLPPNRIVSEQTTTTSLETVTGGSVTTTRVTPTRYTDTPESQAIGAQADQVRDQKAARAQELRDQGLTSAQVLRDPEYRRLSQEQQSLQNQRQEAKAVSQQGEISVSRQPGPNITLNEQTVSESFQTTGTTVVDPQVQNQQVNALASDRRVENTAPATVPPSTENFNSDGSVRSITTVVVPPSEIRTSAIVPSGSVDATGREFRFDDQGELIPADFQDLPPRVENIQPATPGQNLSAAINPETGEYGVWDNNRGVFVPTGSQPLTEQEAQALANAANRTGDPFVPDAVSPANINREPQTVNQYQVLFNDGTGPGTQGTYYVVDQFNNPAPGSSINLTEGEARRLALELNDPFQADLDDLTAQATAQSAQDPLDQQREAEAAQREADAVAAARERARVQAILADQQRQADQGDWRFKIRLAPGARYLYRGQDGQGVQSGILAPLAVTDGVVFPYTPAINMRYEAQYNEQDLPHSNYRGYFYNSSRTGTVSVTGRFTAQDTSEANYLLAVIHFFRAATKMFYGQDDEFRGAPPPLVFLQGFGAYQFARHPCVITSFDYRLPDDVDYIRADVQPISGLNIQQERRPGGVPPQSLPTNVFTAALARLGNAGVSKGAIYRPPATEILGTNSPTYVPTMMEINLELLPQQTRAQASQQFSMREFASGNLLRKGFW